nr:reverse transcriptase domain-containing protein [Tanacetum cinerariifolium]
MTGVPRSVAEHRLNVREGCPPVRQKKMGQAPERTKAIQAEVEKLVEARIMREVYYHDWLSNPVSVKKHDGSWRMCVDFTDLNKACSQDCYPLPEIDWKVESLCGYPFKCFLDTYKGYHQIQMAAADEEKTAFHTGQGVYCYTKMPFGLKNAGATYQRLMDKAFENQMGGNIEVYVDDLVVKSHIEAKMVRDIEETFQTLRKINMKLNPKKCSFGLAEGVFLGKKASNIFSGTSYHGNHRPAHQTGHVSSRRGRTTAKMEHYVHNITYRPRTSIKGQILADFLNEMPSNTSQGALVAKTQEEPWTLFIDGSSCVDGSGEGLILTNPDGVEFTYALRFQFAVSNNEAEYEALIAGLRIATQMGVKNVQANVDSKLVANQVLGTYVAKEDNMIKYLDITKGLVSGFKTFSISQVPWSRNKKADALSKIAKRSDSSDRGRRSNLDDGISDYLKEGILPGDEKEVWKLRLKARQYELIEGALYKRSFLTPCLRCVGPLQAEYIMKEIHEGSCSMHAGPRSAPFRKGQESKVPDSRNGLLHEVDRSKSGGNDYRRTSVEILIPAEIVMPTYRTTAVDVGNNDEELRLNLDLLEERRELAAMNEARSKSKMMKYYNSRVRGVAFKPGDFVYCSNDASHAVAGGKLGPK